jgi:hypothetical protein
MKQMKHKQGNALICFFLDTCIHRHFQKKKRSNASVDFEMLYDHCDSQCSPNLPKTIKRCARDEPVFPPRQPSPDRASPKAYLSA